MGACALVAVALFAQVNAAYAAPVRRLLPQVAAALEATISQNAALQLAEGTVETASARLKVCQGPSACADVTLSDPENACTQAKVGPWCVAYAGAPPAFAAALQERLQAMSVDTVWQAAEAKAPPRVLEKPEPTPTRPAPDTSRAWPLALACLLVPIVLGVVLGRFARRRPRPRAWASAAAVVLAGGVTTGLAVVPVVGAWDAAFAVALLAISAIWSARPATRASQWALAAIALVLGGAEAAARAKFGAPHRSVPLPAQFLFTDHPAPDDAAARDPGAVCFDLFESPTATEDPPRRKKRVLVLGDETAASEFLRPDTRIAKQLDLGADVTSVNRTVPDTSLDTQMLLALREIPRMRPRLVLLFLNDQNDLGEVGQKYACCGDRPMLNVPETGTPTAACTETATVEVTQESGGYLATSPWPYALRVLASRLAAANLVLDALDQTRATAGNVQTLEPPARLALYTRLLAALRDYTAAEHVRLVIVALPQRGHEREPYAATSVFGLARAAHLDVLDASGRFTDALDHGEPLYFSADPTDPRLGAAGTRLLASWLAPQLLERIAAPN